MSTRLCITLLLMVIVIMGLAHKVHSQETTPEASALEPTPFKLTCRYGTTENGAIERCTFTPDPNRDLVCPVGQVQICIRQWGTRTCDCYPE